MAGSKFGLSTKLGKEKQNKGLNFKTRGKASLNVW